MFTFTTGQNTIETMDWKSQTYLFDNLGTDCIIKYVKLSSTHKYYLQSDEILLQGTQEEWKLK
jgi:hypothetical protein